VWPYAEWAKARGEDGRDVGKIDLGRGNKPFKHRLIVGTTKAWTQPAANALQGQPRGRREGIDDWRPAPFH
jgi:hypothetical protein